METVIPVTVHIAFDDNAYDILVEPFEAKVNAA